MKLRAPEYIVIFLILMVTCSTYYLHWTHGPESHDHEKYQFRKHVNVEAPQDVSEAIKEPPKITPKKPLLQKQPVSTTLVAAPEEVPTEVPTEDTIVVAVPTHNRIGYVQLTSAALKGTFPAEDIWIFDDKSSEYSTDDLLEWYGTEHVWQSKKRLKADAMARHILEWFLSTKYDVLVLLDSDLIVAPDWHAELRTGLRESTGLLSLYRSGAPKHNSTSCGDVLCQQPSMGNAGTVWRRDLAKRMLAAVTARDGGFDWGWSEWCTKNKVPMEALKKSAVLHIGMYGSWSHESTAEKSVGFPMGELSEDIRRKAEDFLKGVKPRKITYYNQIEHGSSLQAVQNVNQFITDLSLHKKFDCRKLMSAQIIQKLGHGISKQAFKISIGSSLYIAKRVSKESPDKRTRMGVYKLLKEAHILSVLSEEDANAMKLEGVCIFSEDGDMEKFTEGITILYEVQEKHEKLPTAFEPWLLLLKRFERSRLGSIRITDTKRDQFTVIRGEINMHDMDDVDIHPMRPPKIVRSNCNEIIKHFQIETTIDKCVAAVLKPIEKQVAKQVVVKRPNDILWVIPAFKRAWSLDIVLKSLASQNNILVSKDADSDEIDSVLKKYSADVISHPWSCSRHPEQFPANDESLNENYKGDTYGNPRSPWATCLKHHWWWMMKQAWARKPARVCVLEDDTVIHPQAFEWLASHSGNVKLTPEEIAVPWCMSAKEWQAIDPKAFCEHDDYNWDQTIAWMKEHVHKNEAIVPSVSLSMHVGDCGGWDAGGRDKACTPQKIVKIRANVEQWLGKPVVVNTIKKKWLTAHSKPNGGWGHPKDWAHCLGEKDTCLQWSNVGGCRHHAASDAWLCKFDWMSMNTNDIHVSKGGSKIRDVLDRPENAEFVRLDKHSIGIPYIPHGPNEWHHKKLISAATTKKHKCEQTITGTTLFFERIEYANLWHTMNDWFNVHWTLETIGNPSQVTIVWLDGHAWGHLDDAWGEIFSARTRYVSEFSDHVCFENAVWVPKNTPVWNTDMPSGTCGIMDRFVQRVLTAYGITPSLSEDVVIDRKDYRAHPRHRSGTKNDRIIEHLDKMFPSSKVVQLEAMTFKEQVQLIAHTKRLRGVHGAGLTHLIWLPDGAEVVEWVAPSHASVKLFEHIATWRPNIHYSSAKIPRHQTPLVEKHRLTILIPFREKISDKKSQGSGREKNLREWLEYMSSFLKMPADVIIVEQSQEGTFNKGFLFNVGFKESQNSDYFVLHDVDQIPENPTNDYSFKKRPTHLLTSTSQWNYKKSPSGNVGGALMITRQKYQEINGYSNNFGGWGREDDNMALRLQKHGGYDRLPPEVGRYKELKHPRVMGLDETEQFHKNVANTNDFTSGLSDLKYEIIASEIKTYGLLRVKRMKVKQSEQTLQKTVSKPQSEFETCSFEINEPFDIVIPWVNWTHPNYIRQMKEHNIFDGIVKENTMRYNVVSDSDAYSELKYLLQSIESKYKSYGNIYLVINPIHGPPTWLSRFFPHVKVIHHDNLVSSEFLPTNNAWAISMFLHRIPKLRKWFVKLYDDIFLNKKFVSSDNFNKNNQLKIHSFDVHCPLFVNTCVMKNIEKKHADAFHNVLKYRKKSDPYYQPEIDLNKEYINWMINNKYAVYKKDEEWFQDMHTNGWSQNYNTVQTKWKHRIKILEKAIWLNFQGDGISWEYPKNIHVSRLYKTWIEQKLVSKIAILIPFRDLPTDKHSQGSGRTKNLKVWEKYMKNKLDVNTDVFIIEQDSEKPFNKGALFNIGYHVVKNQYDCLILHDVDLVPLKTGIYKCSTQPMRLISKIVVNDDIDINQNDIKGEHKWDIHQQWHTGGVFAIKTSDYEKVNGYSNKFWGWGWEDQNMAYRLKENKFQMTNLDWSQGTFKQLGHPRNDHLWKEKTKITAWNERHIKVVDTTGVSDVKWHTISKRNWNGVNRIKVHIDTISPVVRTISPDIRLFQCMISNAELIFLEFRLQTTCDYTDFFVIHEAIFDGMHRTKKRYAFEKRDFLESLCPGKIIWTQQHEKSIDNGWSQEVKARNTLMEELKKAVHLSENDIIVLTDADEVVNPNTLDKIRGAQNFPIGIRLFPFKFTLFWRYGKGTTNVCSAARVRDIRNLNDLRHAKPKKWINNAGLHFSWVGSPEYIIQKAKQAINADGRVGDDSTKMTISYVRDMVCKGHDWDKSTHWGHEPKYIENTEWPTFFNKYQYMIDKSVWCKTQISKQLPITTLKISDYMSSDSWATTKIIQTTNLFAAIDYNAPENKGPWKQGWDYDYDGRFKDGLTVHVVPHSHNDPGWIKTYHTYYSTQTKHILDTVIAALTEDPRRTFIWAEISYFSLWWNDASPQQKEQAKKLVAEKRLDFVTGGWVMNDEASVTARATRWHLQEGREWLQNTFGITPQYSWAIDPFGHSAGQAQVLKELGYKGMLIQRVHYAVKKQLAQKQQLEFQWQTPAGEIFTHMMPFYSYDGPHTCGPDPSVCCQFDFARIGKGKTWTGCPWGKMAVEITEHNVAERSRTWLDQVYKKAMLYRGKHVFVPVGDDFRYQSMDEAHKQFTNYQKMFDWIKVNVPAVKVSFSTLSRYFDAVRETNVPKLQGSFFPYSDRVQDYWTGYFNSRIFYKGYDRLLESLIAAVESKCPTVDIHLQKRALGIFQHHDGITGTAKSHVVQDYYQTMQKAVAELKSKLKICLDIAAHVIVNPLSVDTSTMKANEIRPYEQDKCVSEKVQFENIKINEHGRILQINGTPVHESLVWRSNKPGRGVAGAYLMSVTSKEDVLQAKTWTTCVANRYKQVETTFDMLKRRIRVYNDRTIEFIYDVDIHARNNGELWAVYKPEWSAERLCSDVHGLTWECHIERKDAPLQAKFWPMPTMAWLSSATKRMTFTGAQPTGVGFHEGAMVLMLDRRGDQDDARGLGQGITDSRPVEMRFGVLMETESSAEQASSTALAIRNWMLNPEIELV